MDLEIVDPHLLQGESITVLVRNRSASPVLLGSVFTIATADAPGDLLWAVSDIDGYAPQRFVEGQSEIPLVGGPMLAGASSRKTCELPDLEPGRYVISLQDGESEARFSQEFTIDSR